MKKKAKKLRLNSDTVLRKQNDHQHDQHLGEASQGEFKKKAQTRLLDLGLTKAGEQGGGQTAEQAGEKHRV